MSETLPKDVTPEEMIEDIIQSFEVARGFYQKLENHTKTEWERLYKIGQFCVGSHSNLPDSLEAFDSVTRFGETKWMEKHFSDDENAKKKRSGEWKYRTYLPKAYSSAKSVVRNAIESVVLSTEEVVPKTETEKRIREAREVSKDPITKREHEFESAIEKARIALEGLQNEVFNSMNVNDAITALEAFDSVVRKDLEELITLLGKRTRS